ncbi:putative ribosomal protein L29e [Helianthus annuus]|nr:putative ribosomal protein L29e [Helianthus annuus]
MAKSKNHTAHNQSYKAHSNDIKKPRKHRHTSTKGVLAAVAVGGSGGWWWLWKWTSPAERTSVFDHLIQVISYAIEVCCFSLYLQ